MADISTDFWSWSSTAASNSPSGSTAIGTGLDDNLRAIQAGARGAIEPATSVAGTNTITASMAGLGSYASGMKVWFTPAGTNTGATTLNINSIGAKNIFAGNTALVGGELHANIPVVVQYDGTQFQLLGPIFKQPTRTVLTSGSGTYTTPTGATRLSVRLVGGGGGGGGTDAASANNGGAGGNTTFGNCTAVGGVGGGLGNTTSAGAGGSGGAASGGDINISGGGGGGAGAPVNGPGGVGGSSGFGGAGKGGSATNNGGSAATNSGGGGGGGGGSTGGPVFGAGGGGAGGYVEKLFIAPAASYSYAVGAAGSAGSGAQSGGTGGSGIIVVDEYYG